MNDLIAFLIKYQKKNNRVPKIIDLTTPLVKRAIS